MTIEETVYALYRIWVAPKSQEYRFVIYRGDQPIAKFKKESEAKLAIAAIAQHHYLQLCEEVQKKKPT